MLEEDNLNAIDRQLAELGLASPHLAEDEADERAEENVKVMVRCRPLAVPAGGGTIKEASGGVKVLENEKSVEVEQRQFKFDGVFGPESNNEQVYMRSARKLVEFAFKGYNCTCFLYGQTGTGKTFTHSSLTTSSFAHLFSLIRSSNTQARFLIRASYYELYNEEIRDLLSTTQGKPLELRESKSRGIYIKDLTCFLVNNLADLEKLKSLGDKRRTIAATKMNEHSSRSHSIFSVTIETIDAGGSSNSNSRPRPSSQKSAGAQAAVRVGRLNLIDLAGSERQSKSGSSGARLKEASRINLSLTCLSLVIRALTDSNSSHIPYRNSKLTRLLSSSLGGNSKTLLIACISPARSSLDETLNTLRFASRTKRIKNSAMINEDAKDALLRNYRKQVEELRLRLREQQSAASQLKPLTDEEAIESLIQNKPQEDSPKQTKPSGELLHEQLRLLKGKIMVGGENLLEKAELHERLLEASRAELEEKRLEELKLKERLERKRQLIESMKQSKGTLEGQVASLDEKLKRALILYKRTKEERRDLDSEHQQLKESLLQTIRATSKEIKYADCIIEDFIPCEYLDLIDTYARYDDESDVWQIKYIALSGNNIAQTKRLTESQAVQMGEPNKIPNKTDMSIKSDSSQPSNNIRPDPYIRLRDLIK